MIEPFTTRQHFPVKIGIMKIKSPATLALFSFFSSLAAAQTVPPSTPAQDMGRVEIKTNRDNVTEERRQSTAAKIVIGREELDKQGDSTLGEVLKRLPGVFAAGEMLDGEAPTGGYLLQACFATGAAAGRGALKYLGAG